MAKNINWMICTDKNICAHAHRLNNVLRVRPANGLLLLCWFFQSLLVVQSDERQYPCVSDDIKIIGEQ